MPRNETYTRTTAFSANLTCFSVSCGRKRGRLLTLHSLYKQNPSLCILHRSGNK